MENRLEPIIATTVTRPRYYASNVLLALGTSTLCFLLAATLIGILAGGAGIGISFGDTMLQAAAAAPAVWTIVAVSIAVVGARPIVTLAAWAGVLVSFALTLLGPTFRLPDWALGISPFWHIPHTTAAGADLTGLIWISLFTLGFLIIGFGGFRRRDLAR